MASTLCHKRCQLEPWTQNIPLTDNVVSGILVYLYDVLPRIRKSEVGSAGSNWVITYAFHTFTSSTAKKRNTAWQRAQNTAATVTRSVFFISINFLRGLCGPFKPCPMYFSSQLDWIRSPKEGIWNIDVELSAVRFSCVYHTAERP